MTIKITGVIAMGSAAFIFTNYHDVMTTILSICGLVGIFGILRALYMNKMIFFMIFGMVCLVFIILNNLFYYKEEFNAYLPVIQQLDFILVLAWTVSLNLMMKNKTAQEQGI